MLDEGDWFGMVEKFFTVKEVLQLGGSSSVSYVVKVIGIGNNIGAVFRLKTDFLGKGCTVFMFCENNQTFCSSFGEFFFA